MTTLVEYMIVVGAENRPHMLDKLMYNSWESRMLLYIKGKKNGIMMLELIENGPLVYLIVEEDGQIRKKKYVELIEQEQLLDDCDIQATNIVLQGLPPDVYALFNHFQSAKDIWERVKLLMKGTKLSYQECECKLYNEFDKFALVKGETLHEYYFAQLINDMYTIGITIQQVQVNTKFLNALQLEWNKFVTDESGQVLDEEQLAFLADPGITNAQDAQPTIIHNATFQIDDLQLRRPLREQAFLLQFLNPNSEQPIVQTTHVRTEAPSEIP
nr:hypothetical protein [Tanacetum cinerariifolium]